MSLSNYITVSFTNYYYSLLCITNFHFDLDIIVMMEGFALLN